MFFTILLLAGRRLSSRLLSFPVLAAGVFLSLLSSCSQSSSAQNLLSPEEFSREMTLPGAILLDVRTPGEFADGHLIGARLADWNDAGFGAAVAGLPRDQTVLVYCLAGGRSAAAAGYLRKQGFVRVLELDGGIDRWNARGLPTEAGSKAGPPGKSPGDLE
jgi:rhodanese-related sulfurtransferase